MIRRRRRPRVGADTLHRVAAAPLVTSGGSFGRRATAAAVHRTFAGLQRELTCRTGGVRAAVDSGWLQLLLLLLMLLPGPGRVHLATIVGVEVVEVGGGLRLLVAGASGSVGDPPEAWQGSRIRFDENAFLSLQLLCRRGEVTTRPPRLLGPFAAAGHLRRIRTK